MVVGGHDGDVPDSARNDPERPEDPGGPQGPDPEGPQGPGDGNRRSGDPFDDLLGRLVEGLGDGLRDLGPGLGALLDPFGRDDRSGGPAERRDPDPRSGASGSGHPGSGHAGSGPSGSGAGSRTGPRPGARPRARTPWLDRHGRDLTADATAGRIDPVIGRDAEIAQVTEILARRTKNNPVLLGEPGVGKTAIVEGIAARIASGDVPASLAGRRLVALDLAGMVAGTRYRGEFEERLHAVIEEVTAADGELVVFVDELHTVVGAGSTAEGSLDASAILKPALARGTLRLVGATTTAEYRRHVESDPALARRLAPVVVDEPGIEESVRILDGLAPRYADHHGVELPPAARRAAVELTSRHVRDRHLPDKAVDALDRAAARVAMRQAGDAPAPRADGTARAPEVTVTDVAAVVADTTGLPVAHLTATDRDRLLGLGATLRQRVIGQDHAVDAVADAVVAGRAGLADPARPLGSFLFVGPTGVGKTELARALAAALHGTGDALVRLDMAEFAEAHAVTRLTGAPPGYIGHDRPGELTEAVRRRPSCVLLLDEIEKAHPDVVATLLGVLDAGRLTDSHGHTASFSDAVVVMTSNLGASELVVAGDPERARGAVTTALRRRLPAEFLARVDDVVLFGALDAAALRGVVDLALAGTRDRLAAQGIGLEVSDAALDRLVAQGREAGLGARPLRGLVARGIDRPVSRRIVAGAARAGVTVNVDVAPAGDGLAVEMR